MSDIFYVFKEVGKEITESMEGLLEKEDRFRVTGMGADGTLTHLMDKECEDILINRVKEYDLPYNIISEEAGVIDRGYDKNILADPLDGTFNAENGIPFYSISLATLENNFDTLETGFIMNLANKDVYSAKRGEGATKNNRKIGVAETRRYAYILSLGTRMDPVTRKILKMPGKHRSMGCASLELALVASGSVDLVAYMGRKSVIRNVDVAAGVLLVMEANGVAIDSEGNQFSMGIDVSERKNIIAASNPKIMEGLI